MKRKVYGTQPIQSFNTIRRIYRRFRPIPKSPKGSTPEELQKLILVPTDSLTKKFVQAINLLRANSINVFGDYLEFGVYNGTSMICMHEALLATGLEGVRLIGFDSFKGLPPEAADDDGGDVWQSGQFGCPQDVTLQRLGRAGVPMRSVSLVPGWFKDTLTEQRRAELNPSPWIVMIDCDTYTSAHLALEYLWPIMSNPCVLFFDDWRLNDLDIKGMGELRAFSEFIKKYSIYRVIDLGEYSRKSKVYLVYKERN